MRRKREMVEVLPGVYEAVEVPRLREGRVLIAGFFAPEVSIALKVIAAEERTTVQALLAESINTVFAKRGKPEIAAFSFGEEVSK